MQRHIEVIFEAILSVLIIGDLLFMGLMIAGLIVGIKTSTVYSIGSYDLIIAILILIDLIIYRNRTNKLNDNNWQFIYENWAYILSLIPITFICFNIFHLFSFVFIVGLLVIIRFYALYKVLRITGRDVSKYPSKTKLDYATVVLFLVLIIGSFLFYLFEHSVNPEVPNYESSMWYSIVSMTTVGYGDIVPVTGIGRIIGIILIVTGMGYLSIVTATLAFSFIEYFKTESRKAADEVEKKIDKRIENKVINIDDNIDELKHTVIELKETINDLQEKIDKIKK